MSSSGCDSEEVEVEDNPGKCTDFEAWTAACLPFLGERSLAEAYCHQAPWSSLSNRRVVKTQLSVFACPSAPERERIDRYHVKGAAATDFGAVVQVDRGVYTDLFGVPDPGVASRHGVLAKYESSSPREITDGLSNTLMISECAGRAAAYVLGRPMTARQFSRYRDDDIVKISGQFLVDEGIGWADPDSGFSIEGVGDNGVELYFDCFRFVFCLCSMELRDYAVSNGKGERVRCA
jgi:hypothetical protein